MKVALIYRNYKKLHPLYQSLVADPPEGVMYEVAPARTRLKFLFPLLTKFSSFSFVRMAIRFAEKLAFALSPPSGVDLLHYTQLLPPTVPSTPFVVDFSHPISFFSHMAFSESDVARIWKTVTNSRCKALIALSDHAAIRLGQLFVDYPFEEQLLPKIQVVYPALAQPTDVSSDDRYISKKRGVLDLLFVGNEVYRKGLHELLLGVSQVSSPKIRLHVVSDAPEELIARYALDQRISFYQPTFSKQEIMRYFFKQADVFVMPTHADYFGMVFLDALACGVPVITTRQFVGKEIIVDGQNGFFVESQRLLLEKTLFPDQVTLLGSMPHDPEPLLVESLKEKISQIVDNPSLIEPMRVAAAKDFELGGRFAVSTRNQMLLSLYQQALEE